MQEINKKYLTALVIKAERMLKRMATCSTLSNEMQIEQYGEGAMQKMIGELAKIMQDIESLCPADYAKVLRSPAATESIALVAKRHLDNAQHHADNPALTKSVQAKYYADVALAAFNAERFDTCIKACKASMSFSLQEDHPDKLACDGDSKRYTD